MGGRGGVRRERRAREPPSRGPLRRAVRGAGTEAELGRPAVGPSVEAARRLEVTLGDRGGRAPAGGVQLGGDEQCPGQFTFAVPRPARSEERRGGEEGRSWWWPCR